MDDTELEKYKQLVLQTHERNRDFVKDVDGFVYFWPTSGGHMPAAALRIVADELDRRNKDWNDTIDQYFAQFEAQQGPEFYYTEKPQI